MCLVPHHCTICTAYFWAGCVGFLLSVMGCVGAWREKAGLINCYAVLIAMIAVGENQCCGAEAGLFCWSRSRRKSSGLLLSDLGVL